MDTQTSIPIISPKLQIPPPKLNLVQRESLLEALNGGLQRKLTLISAPAGYGKTTLLSGWAAQYKWRLAWVTLAPGDNDTERFLTYLISAIQAAQEEVSSLDSLLGPRFSLQPMPPDAILAILVNQLSAAKEPLTIVLDDYQLIENGEIHEFLTGLLDNLPVNTHIIVSTRSDPPLRLAHLRAKDHLNEFTEKDLRFTSSEAGAFFNGVMGLSLTKGQVAALENRTEGWVTGLQLAGLSLKDREQPDELIDTLAGTHRYILDYLVEEVFSDLPPILQEFLLKVSILERLSPGLCDALAGDLADESGDPLRSKEVLAFLDASNLFVTPLDSQRQWYRFHPLFADFLKDRLTSDWSHEVPGLHRAAARWYNNHDLLSEAVGHCFAAEDMHYAADLIQSQAKELLGRGEVSTLLGWIEALPEDVISARTQLGLARIWSLLMIDPIGSRKKALRQVKQIAQGLGVEPDSLLNVMAESGADPARLAELSEFAMLQAFIQRDSKDLNHTIDLFNAALASLPEHELVLRGFTQAGLASTYGRAGNIKLAEQTFAAAAQTSLAANSLYGFVACTDWQATAQVELGQLKRAAKTYRRAIDSLSEQGRPPLPLSGHVFVGLASVQLEWNELDKALENVETGLTVGVQVRDIDALLSGYPLQARIFTALNKDKETQEALEKAEQTALQTEHPGCILESQAQKASLDLIRGDMEEARNWAVARGFAMDDYSDLEPPPAEIEYLTLARLLIAEGKSSDALPILAEMLVTQERMGRMRAALETLTLQALCYRAIGHTDGSLRALGRALLLAEPEGFVRIFLDAGPPMAALLRTAGAKGHSPEYVKKLLTKFGEAAATSEAPIETLSEREIEVLRLISAGYTNAEIATELVIAQSTVKTHINHIYSKLGVKTRTQAVARARQLQILS